MTLETSPRWELYKDLVYLPDGFHDISGDEPFPRNRHGKFEVITTWGERFIACIDETHPVREQEWNTNPFPQGSPSRLKFMMNGYVRSFHVAAWRRISSQ